jgi:hypothetical protein
LAIPSVGALDRTQDPDDDRPCEAALVAAVIAPVPKWLAISARQPGCRRANTLQPGVDRGDGGLEPIDLAERDRDGPT